MKKNILLKLLFFMGIFLLVSLLPLSGAWLTGWDYRKKITIQGTNLDSNQTHFPVYVYLNPASSGSGLASKIRNDGYDIRFTKADGETLLYYEREYYNESGGNSEGHFWVSKSDWTINADGSTYFYMYYGKSDATDGNDGLNGNVWDSNFIGVYHLKESGNGSESEFKDSSGNANHGQGGGGDSGECPTQTDGKIYKGQDFDGNNDHIDLDDINSLEGIGILTLSAWTYAEETADDYSGIVTKGRSASGMNNGSWALTQRFSNVRFMVTTSAVYHCTGNDNIESGWHYLTGIYDGSDIYLYVDSIQDATTASVSGNINQCSYTVKIGKWDQDESDAYNQSFNGLIDEARLSNTNRTVAWQKFEYHNIHESDQELTWDVEEDPNGENPDFPNIYIDEGCAGTHVGSLANPYDDLSDINWTTGGDNSIFDYLAGSPTQSPTIHLKKGDTWNELLAIGCSGTATYRIIITSYGTGEKPYIDGNGLGDHTIKASNKDYITIDGLKIRDDDNYHCIEFVGGSDNIIIRNCEINHPGKRGIQIFNCTNFTIEYNLIDTTAIDNQRQADGIYIESGSGGHLIRWNIILAKQDGYYVDGIQIVGVSGTTTIEYNWVENVDGYASDQGSIGIQIAGSGTFNVRYNVILNNNTNTQSCLLLVAVGTYNIYNNTMVNLCSGCSTVFINNITSGFTFKNNIFYATNDFCVESATGEPSPAGFDYNCYYRVGGGNLVGGWGSQYSWSQWKTAGAEADGINANPLLRDIANSNYHLKHGSPCRGKGTDVGLTIDYEGKPIQHGIEIGAYECDVNALFFAMGFNPLDFLILALIAFLIYRRRNHAN